MKPFQNKAVENVFQAYQSDTRKNLLALRNLIFEVAKETEGVGELEETLKWNQPSYLTSQTKSGTTIRIDQHKDDDKYAMYFHCQTTLVDTFKEIYPATFYYEGNRAIVFRKDDKLPIDELGDCVARALTYHLKKK